MQQLALPLSIDTGTAKRLDPRETVLHWATQAHDVPALAQALGAMGWTHARISSAGTQLEITGPSGIRITLWQGLERSTVIAQLSLAWLGPLGVITERDDSCRRDQTATIVTPPVTSGSARHAPKPDMSTS